MQKYLFTAILCLFFVQNINAQQFQVSLMSGISKTDFQTFVAQPIDKNAHFTFTSLAFFQRFHKELNQPFDELGVQGAVFWNFTKSLGIGPGLYYNSPKGLMPRGVVQSFHKVGALTLITNPALYYHEDGYWGGEFFGQLTYIDSVTETWSLFLKADILTTWDRFEDHGRSFIQLRAGPRLPAGIQFGLAYDHDWYTPQKFSRRSLGLFVEQWF